MYLRWIEPPVFCYDMSMDRQLTATCMNDHCFCEELHIDGLIQPINSISSLAFVVFGLIAIAIWLKFKKDTIEKPIVLAFAITLILIGLSSSYYHGSLSFLGQFLDIFSMYIFGTLLIIRAMVRRSVISLRTAIALFLAANILLGIIQYTYPDARRILFALILLPGIVLEFLPATTGFKPFKKEMRFMHAGVGLLITGYTLWVLDQNNILCSPSSIFQGHGLWHILTALAGLMVVLHYRQTHHKKQIVN